MSRAGVPVSGWFSTQEGLGPFRGESLNVFVSCKDVQVVRMLVVLAEERIFDSKMADFAVRRVSRTFQNVDRAFWFRVFRRHRREIVYYQTVAFFKVRR